ncbi:unnamed protein product [Closterium sp. Yama58-4]|nr:unnamed protein product [Closterium sp. Yama58-4]
MMDPVLVLIIASCMTLTQFALQLKENITTSAYLKNFDLMLESTASLHALLTEFKGFKGWGVATDGAKKSFQRLEDLLRKATALLQRCISARSKLLQLVSEHALQAQDFVKMHAELEQCLSTVPIQTLPEPLTSKLTAMRQQLLNTPFTECVTPAMRAQLQLLLSSAASPSPALKDAPGSDVLAFQLAEALGLGLSAEAANPGALRREQEALALEKRKAQEGRDLAQAKVVEQIVLVLMRMEREVAARREKQKRAAEAVAGAGGTATAPAAPAPSSIFAPQPSRSHAPAAAPGINLLAESLTELSVIDALLPLAAASSPQEAKAADAAVRALGNLLADEDVKVELIGHLPLLVQALKRAQLPATRAGMARIFKAIATISDEACKVVVDAGAVPHLAKFVDPSAAAAAATANPPPMGGAAVAAAAAAEEASKQCAAETLAILAQVPSKRSRMVADGAVGPLSLLVLASPPNETLIAAVTALAGLASVHEGREGMGAVLPTLVNLLRVEDEGVMAPTLDVLLLLAKHSAGYRSGIRNNGGMRHLRNVLRVGPSPLHNKGMELLAALFS